MGVFVSKHHRARSNFETGGSARNRVRAKSGLASWNFVLDDATTSDCEASTAMSKRSKYKIQQSSKLFIAACEFPQRGTFLDTKPRVKPRATRRQQ